MLKLGSREPEWIAILPGAEIQFEKIGIKAVRAARRACAAALGVDADDIEEAADALSRELIRRGIRDWRGIGDAAGEPLPVNPETIELLMADPDAYEACDRLYVGPWTKRDIMGNASAGSPNGTGAQATPANITASSRARPKRTGGAKNARTSSKSSRATKPKASGQS